MTVPTAVRGVGDVPQLRVFDETCATLLRLPLWRQRDLQLGLRGATRRRAFRLRNDLRTPQRILVQPAHGSVPLRREVVGAPRCK